MDRNGNYFQPIALWSGRLILPGPEERREDGGVFILMENVPESHRSLLGKKAWLTWKASSPLARIAGRETVDMVFTAETLKSRDKGNIHPDRLNGWRRVSPLETLAGCRRNDDVQVRLKDVTAVYTAGTALVQTGEEPVQIAGETSALVKFMEPSADLNVGYLVRHYNITTGEFDGPAEKIIIPAIPMREKPPLPAASLERLHETELNDHGWYVYGSMRNGIFTVKALEPRRLFMLKPTEYRHDAAGARQYINCDSWKDMKRGSYRIALLDSSPAQHLERKDYSSSSSLVKEGDTGLVAHLFGWIGGPGGEKPDRWGLVSGHSSFGIASVARDIFTGDLRWYIEYKQVYAHNPEGIAAGAQSWHCYMGGLSRGWMYLPPVSDAIILHPCLNYHYRFGTIAFTPLREIETELFRISCVMRSGGGTGLSPVTIAESCSQNSTMALHSLWRRLKERCFSSVNVRRWVKKNGMAQQAVYFKSLMSIVMGWDSYFRPFITVPPRWKRYRDMKPYRRLAGMIGVIIDGLLTFRSILPRGVFDGVCGIMISRGAKIWIIRTDGIGGEMPGVIPLWPTTFHRRHPVQKAGISPEPEINNQTAG